MDSRQDFTVVRTEKTARSTVHLDRFHRLLLVLFVFFAFAFVGFLEIGEWGAVPVAAIAPGLTVMVWLDHLDLSIGRLTKGASAITLGCALSALFYTGIYWSTKGSGRWGRFAPVAAIPVTLALLLMYRWILKW